MVGQAVLSLACAHLEILTCWKCSCPAPLPPTCFGKALRCQGSVCVHGNCPFQLPSTVRFHFPANQIPRAVSNQHPWRSPTVQAPRGCLPTHGKGERGCFSRALEGSSSPGMKPSAPAPKLLHCWQRSRFPICFGSKRPQRLSRPAPPRPARLGGPRPPGPC